MNRQETSQHEQVLHSDRNMGGWNVLFINTIQINEIIRVLLCSMFNL